MEGRRYYVYILTNKVHGTLYTGVTNSLLNRISEHKNKIYQGFTRKYGVSRLVYYEVIDGIEAAIAREKQLKNWHRQWKINLINQKNPEWRDLYTEVIDAFT